MTGIGGQGVQLAAQLLARAAIRAGQHAQLFGSYGGMMRGGNTDATLIISDAPVQAPPMVGSAWSGIVMHHEYAQPVYQRVRGAGLLVVNTSVVTPQPDPSTLAESVTVLAVAASEIAIGLGAAAAATMVAVGAYVAVTQLVQVEELVQTVPEVLPSYRQQHVESNVRALHAGAEAGLASGLQLPAWAAGAAA
jgi:Pyruvate/2-oxoacid:ferredoxin oxidoreductase gamma subunit